MRGGSRRCVCVGSRKRKSCVAEEGKRSEAGAVRGAAAAAVGPGGVRGQRQRQSHQKLQAKGKIV